MPHHTPDPEVHLHIEIGFAVCIPLDYNFCSSCFIL